MPDDGLGSQASVTLEAVSVWDPKKRKPITPNPLVRGTRATKLCKINVKHIMPVGLNRFAVCGETNFDA